MKQLGIIIFIVSLFLVSCQKEDLISNIAVQQIANKYELEAIRFYPNTGAEIAIKSKVNLTFTPRLDYENQIWIEEYGIYAIISGNELNIPFQTDIAGQFSYVGYGSKDEEGLELFLQIKNHTAEVTERIELKSTENKSILN